MNIHEWSININENENEEDDEKYTSSEYVSSIKAPQFKPFLKVVKNEIAKIVNESNIDIIYKIYIFIIYVISSTCIYFKL
jgi:hypothetical protein